MEAKAEVGALPKRIVAAYNAKIDDALKMIPLVHAADCRPHALDRDRALAELGD